MTSLSEIHQKLCASVRLFHNVNAKHHAELFDTHPISGMLVSDNDLNEFPNLIKISNAWRSDWTKNGVQVSTCDSADLPAPVVSKADLPTLKRKAKLSPLPDKLIRCSRDSFYDANLHHISKKGINESSHYQTDNLDHAWLLTVNEERECLGEEKIQDWMLETVLESAEEICCVKYQNSLKQDEPKKSIEFDENTRCDICLSYDGEDGNELVFCDGCFVCVHQACYGIPQLPEGSWLCRRCEMGAKSTTQCILCPNTGGAMKLVDDYKSWCHVSCALWVPEVAFADIDLMEPVSKVNEIPQARKNLVCSLCRMHYGAPIQCSVKKCKVAFHVTCAFQKNLVMLQELQHGDVRLLAHCQKHSSSEYQSRLALLRSSKPQKLKKENQPGSVHESLTSTPVKGEDEVAHSGLIDDKYSNFHRLVTNEEVISMLQKLSKQRSAKKKVSHAHQGNLEDTRKIAPDIIDLLLTFWRLKRRANFNRPLIETPESWNESTLLRNHVSESNIITTERLSEATDILNRFKQVRFGLDRARLVIDMVLQREKRKIALLKKQSAIFDLQLNLINDESKQMSSSDIDLFSTAHLGTSIYDSYSLLTFYGDVQKQIEPVRPMSPEHAASLSPNIRQKKKIKIFKPNSPPKVPPSSMKPEINGPTTNYIITGNPVIDGLLPEQLIVNVSARKRLQIALSGNKTIPQKALQSNNSFKTRGRPRSTTSFFSSDCQNQAPPSLTPHHHKKILL